MPRSTERLRTAARLAAIAGAAVSIALWVRASRHPPRLLVVLFVIWVLAPFAALLLAHRASRSWSHPTRATLYVVMLVVTLGSLAVYMNDAVHPRASQPAAVWVIVPAASWLLFLIALPTAAMVSRRRSASM